MPRNFAFHFAKGDYIAFFDDDDYWHPDKLRKQVDLLETHKELDFAITYYQVIREVNKPLIMDSPKV